MFILRISCLYGILLNLIEDTDLLQPQDLKIPPTRILDLACHAGQLTRILQEVLPEEKREWWMVESSGKSGQTHSQVMSSEAEFPVEGALHRDPDSNFTCISLHCSSLAPQLMI